MVTIHKKGQLDKKKIARTMTLEKIENGRLFFRDKNGTYETTGDTTNFKVGEKYDLKKQG